MAKGRVKMNAAGSRAVLTDRGVQAKVREIVDGAAARANAAEETPRIDRGEVYGFEGSVIGNPHSRAGGRVTAVGPTARRRNAQNNTLLKMMGGADMVSYVSKSGRRSLVTRKQAENWSRGSR